MNYNFDEIIDRTNSDSIKWNYYGRDVIPMWVADMDFRSPQPVLDALLQRVRHGVLGYGQAPQELAEVICERLLNLYQWKVSPEEIVFYPGVMVGVNNVIHALSTPGQGVLMQTPVYPPFLTAPECANTFRQDASLQRDGNGQYFIDFDRFEETIDRQTALFLLCNPHNPVGRVFRRHELTRLAEICMKHKLPVCSDEIHCDLLYKGHPHLPIASLGEEIAQNTITLMAPSKTYNLAGLSCSFAVVQNPQFRKRLVQAQLGLVSHINVLGFHAALAAYRHGGEWLSQALDYLALNRDYLRAYVNNQFPAVQMPDIEGTYLAWMDFSAVLPDQDPFKFFLKQAHVALFRGASFGGDGKSFARLNFGCPQRILEEGLQRMKQALLEHGEL